jgi:acyl-coenzyme A thioesterase 9
MRRRLAITSCRVPTVRYTPLRSTSRLLRIDRSFASLKNENPQEAPSSTANTTATGGSSVVPPVTHWTAADILGHSTRTRVTTELWAKRLKTEQEQLQRLTQLMGDNVDLSTVVGKEAPSFLLDKTPAESAIEVNLPFSTDSVLREQYINFYGNLRVGKILEDLDACAGNIAYAHAEDNNPKTRPLTIVTASVDRIDLLNKLLPDRDMRMRGCVTHVGTSSMEIRIEVQSKDPTTESFYPLILATFSMVATFDGKPAPVNRLIPQTDMEKALFAQGEKNKLLRKEWAKASLRTQPPTPSEQALIHEIFMKNSHTKNNADGVQMATTKLQSVALCQPQERNTANKIFGGYLMRKAHELAWTNAHTFCGMRPWFISLDQVTFHQPVSIGSIIFFNSEIVYTESKCVGVNVIAEVLNPLTGVKNKTNTFYFTFTCPDAPVKRVLPNTYEEAMKYIEGKRRYDYGKQVAQSLGSALMRFY